MRSSDWSSDVCSSDLSAAWALAYTREADGFPYPCALSHAYSSPELWDMLSHRRPSLRRDNGWAIRPSGLPLPSDRKRRGADSGGYRLWHAGCRSSTLASFRILPYLQQYSASYRRNGSGAGPGDGFGSQGGEAHHYHP